MLYNQPTNYATIFLDDILIYEYTSTKRQPQREGFYTDSLDFSSFIILSISPIPYTKRFPFNLDMCVHVLYNRYHFLDRTSSIC